MSKNKQTIECNPIRTLGDLIELVDRARNVADFNGVPQADVPVKTGVTMNGRIRSLTLDLSPEGED